MNEENHSEEERLIIRHLSGETNPAEEKTLREWILLATENEETYLALKKTYALSQSYSPKAYDNLDINVDLEWDHFVKKVGEREKIIPLDTKKNNQNVWLKIAAAIFLIVTSGLVVNYFVRSTNYVFQTANNTETVTLPDGSTVFLNRESRLAYSKSFGSKVREVELEGEAFFEVTKDADHPFVIRIDQATVTVLGTSFNVQGYKDKKELEVTVATGVVKLEVTKSNKAIKLLAGEKGILSKNDYSLTQEINSEANYLAWKTKKIIFDRSTLKSVADVLSAVYGVHIRFATPVSNNCEVTATFDGQSLEVVLRVLKSTLNLEYRIEGDSIEIVKAGC